MSLNSWIVFSVSCVKMQQNVLRVQMAVQPVQRPCWNFFLWFGLVDTCLPEVEEDRNILKYTLHTYKILSQMIPCGCIHSIFKGTHRLLTFTCWVWGPREDWVSVYCGTVKASVHPPLHHCHCPPPRKPQTTHIPLAPATLEFRSAGGVTTLLREWLVKGRGGGQRGSRFVFSLGTKDHATENNHPIVWQQKNHN